MEYNCRVYDYPTGQHVTIYTRTISRSENLRVEDKDDFEDLEVEADMNENFTKSYKNEDRTKEQEDHCKKVSLSSTKNRIYNISRSNLWDWFITLTFDRERTDASDYDLVVRRLKIFLNNLQQRQCPDLKYLIVPEFHADNKHYHFHGLLSGCDGLRCKYSGHDTKDGQPIYNILNWTWGFTTATRVYDTQRVSSYITKYITKESCIFLKEKHRYYCSRNINRAKPQYFIVDQEDFLKVYGSSIVYAKSVKVPDANQMINYYELQ